MIIQKESEKYMSTLSNIKDIILTTLEDGKEHSSEEIKKGYCQTV